MAQSRSVNRGGLYLAIYDISVDSERTRASHVLERYGIRVQKSAFEVRLNKGHRAKLLRELAELRIDSGWIALYRLDESARRHEAGRIPERALAELHHAYVL